MTPANLTDPKPEGGNWLVPHAAYHIVNETTGDCFDEVDSLDEALRIARGVAKEGQAGEPGSIEHNGKVIRQLVLTADGKVEEAQVC
jgi:hypothetical protein